MASPRLPNPTSDSELAERHREAHREREQLRSQDHRAPRRDLGMCDQCGRDDYKCRCGGVK